MAKANKKFKDYVKDDQGSSKTLALLGAGALVGVGAVLALEYGKDVYNALGLEKPTHSETVHYEKQIEKEEEKNKTLSLGSKSKRAQNLSERLGVELNTNYSKGDIKPHPYENGIIIIGNQGYRDGDAVPGEDRDDPEVVWDIDDFNLGMEIMRRGMEDLKRGPLNINGIEYEFLGKENQVIVLKDKNGKLMNYRDGDALPGEDKDDPRWVWDIDEYKIGAKSPRREWN